MRVRVSRNFYIVLFMDILLLCISFYLAHLIRFEFSIPSWANEMLIQLLPFVLIGKLTCFFVFDLYKGMWRYTGLNDLLNIVKASSASTLIIIAFILFKNRFLMVSRSVVIIDWCLTIILIVSLRVTTRLFYEEFTEQILFRDLMNAIKKIFVGYKENGKGVIIIGAGDCGQKICREFIENPTVKSHVVGFLDDDQSKINRKIHGITVLGTIDELQKYVDLHSLKDVIIAISTTTGDRMRRIVDICKQADVDFKTVPDMGELIDGRITLNAIRNVEYRDLLGREPVTQDKDKIGKYLNGKNVLVTGAGGSIGSGLCKQICRYSPKTILLFERAESPLYEIDLDLKKSFKQVDVIPILGDIQDENELSKTFEIFKPEIVFHAAAYKHVPMLEHYPWKAVENNIIGTKNLVELADQFSCDKFVFVSTDKAVNPVNVMGVSKRVAEMLVQNQSIIEKSATNFITVRFGNVIGSVGSVIPLFKKQIKEGGPVTVTHPEINRYFMLIPEACQLILQAGAMGKGGEIFILEMGDPVNIDKMARDLIKFSGFEPDKDIKIVYTGLRPGEKIFEELMTDQENVIPTDHTKIMVLNGSEVDLKVVNGKLDLLEKEAQNRNAHKIRQLFTEIIPEYDSTPEQL